MTSLQGEPLMMFKHHFYPGIENGTITTTLRYWKRPQAVAGRFYKIPPVGEIEVVKVTTPKAPTRKDAQTSGFDDLQALRSYLEPFKAEDRILYRVEFRFAGPSTKQEPEALQPDDSAALTKISQALDLRDKNSGRTWTRPTLRLVAAHPGKSSEFLASKLGVERARLKTDMRKLKQLGLTISLETGYRLSKKAQSYLDSL